MESLRRAAVVAVAALAVVALLMLLGRDALLLRAGAAGHYAAARLFIRYSNDIDRRLANGYGILHVAAALDAPDLARTALARGAPVDARTEAGTTPICVASALGNVRMVRFLASAGGNVNLRAATGETPMSVAVRAGHLDVVRALIDNGATCRSGEGPGVLYLAARHDHPELFEILHECGADVNQPGSESALMAAVRWSSIDSVRWLLAAGANANASRSDGATALMLAAELCRADAVDLLISQSADVSARDRDGRTALDYALSSTRGERGRPECERTRALLRGRGSAPKIGLTH